MRLGREAVALLPVERDHIEGCFSLSNLAEVYVVIGDHEAAIDQLEYLLSIPSHISLPILRNDPTWAPLRANPRMQRILAKGQS